MNTPTNRNAVRNIKLAMRDQDVSVQTLSADTRIPRSTLIRRLAGHSPFTTDELHYIAKRLGSNPDDLIVKAVRSAA